MHTSPPPSRTRASAGTPAHFLPHLQGLRAIAVLLVVVYHFWPGRLQGGYIGVDVFFVISGFLITGQLARELDASTGSAQGGRINLPGFYAKRVRRLLPAAVTVLIFSALATLFILPLSSLGENLREILASTFYVENWALAANSVDYLAAANEATLVQHYWSLSLEEQFYLIWPLMLLGASWLAVKFGSGKRWNALFAVVVAVSILSLVFSIVYTQTNAAQAYFVTFTRMWEFGAGAVLALLPRLRPTKAWLSNVLGYGGIAIVLGCGYFYDKSTPFPGSAAILPVVGTMAIILASHRERWYDAGRVLSLRPVSFVGDISYSLYLWHWPLIVIAPFVPGWGLSTINRLVLFVLCFVIAWLTKRFIEDPTRAWKPLVRRKPRFTFVSMIAAMAVVTLVVGVTSLVQQPKYDAAAAELRSTLETMPDCFGAASGLTDGLEKIDFCSNPELEGQIIPSPGFGNADRPQHPDCLVTLNDSTLTSCEFGDTTSDAAPRVAIIGDSHAYSLLDPLIELAETNGWHLTTYLKGACPWSTTPIAGGDAFAASCADWRSKLDAELAEVAPYDAIFTAALADHTVEFDSDEARATTAGFVEAWTPQLDQGTPVVTLVDNPSWETDPNKCLRISDPADCSESIKEGLGQFDGLAAAAYELQAEQKDVTLLDFTQTYCDSSKCFPVIGGANVYRDQDHLTRTFAFTLAPFIESAIVAALGRSTVR
ncbi:acyltransferase family protein [Agreia sp. Leaf244]|uniref:acyltransferase family protein n=1 Tax=Agreia sp. Leaf244 TaxID=1736305 RepID=UPI00138EEA1F|nr:acyltransferase family protein [Agreia sp. Leaf244]